MSGAPPSGDGGHCADERFVRIRQADRDDVLLVDDVTAQSKEGDVVLEVGRVVVGMHLFTFDVVILVRKRLVEIPSVPFSQTDPDARCRSANRKFQSFCYSECFPKIYQRKKKGNGVAIFRKVEFVGACRPTDL